MNKLQIKNLITEAIEQSDYWLDKLECLYVDAEPSDCLLQNGVLRMESGENIVEFDVEDFIKATMASGYDEAEQILQYIMFGYVRYN